MIIDWLPEANRNRIDQLDDIAEDSPLAAADQDDEVERQVNMLHAHPKMGRPGRVKGTRELVISSTPFILVYRLNGTQRIEVLRLLHGSQRWPPESAPKAAAVRRPPPRGGGETLGAARHLFLSKSKIKKRILHNQK